MLLKASVDADRCGGAASKGSRESASRGRASRVLRLPMAPISPQIPTASTTAGAVFERNLAALAARNADVIEALRATQPLALEWSTATDGSSIATHDGRALASRHAPRDEAANFADATDLREKAVVAVLGFGLGYHVAPRSESTRLNSSHEIPSRMPSSA